MLIGTISLVATIILLRHSVFRLRAFVDLLAASGYDRLVFQYRQGEIASMVLAIRHILGMIASGAAAFAIGHGATAVAGLLVLVIASLFMPKQRFPAYSLTTIAPHKRKWIFKVSLLFLLLPVVMGGALWWFSIRTTGWAFYILGLVIADIVIPVWVNMAARIMGWKERSVSKKSIRTLKRIVRTRKDLGRVFVWGNKEEYLVFVRYLSKYIPILYTHDYCTHPQEVALYLEHDLKPEHRLVVVLVGCETEHKAELSAFQRLHRLWSPDVVLVLPTSSEDTALSVLLHTIKSKDTVIFNADDPGAEKNALFSEGKNWLVSSHGAAADIQLFEYPDMPEWIGLRDERATWYRLRHSGQDEKAHLNAVLYTTALMRIAGKELPFEPIEEPTFMKEKKATASVKSGLKSVIRDHMECALVKTELGDFGKQYRGKVRDTYAADGKLILVSTDRISAFDHVLNEAIPFKGQVLNQLAAYFFEHTADVVPNHMLSVPDPNVTIGVRCQIVPIEFVMRGYLAGHAARVYHTGKRELCGISLVDGLIPHQKLPQPILTPTTKAAEGHDIDISREEILRLGILTETEFDTLEAMAFNLFSRGSEMALARGLLLVDTKYEFGKDPTGRFVVADEVHTPDSSRYYLADSYETFLNKAESPRQLSKEFVREWLMERGFQGKVGEHMPHLDEAFREMVALRYIELFEQITGRTFVPDTHPCPEVRIRENLQRFFYYTPAS
ncbi:MAG TPA: phosphoribosylaminoimidazolesuccinocarboxamide synthase [Rhodothermales bacterium]|nr:phosphoribosylaminoimidazolesuccinocarboxamide synthase [Rhodothermales bacterium]